MAFEKPKMQLGCTGWRGLADSIEQDVITDFRLLLGEQPPFKFREHRFGASGVCFYCGSHRDPWSG